MGTAGWGSRNAEEFFRFAVTFAGYEARDLMMEIQRRQGRRQRTVNLATVYAAMDTILRRDRPDWVEQADRASRAILGVVIA